MNPGICFLSTPFKGKPCHSIWKQYVIFHKLFKSKKRMVFIDLWNIVSHAFIFMFVQDKRKWIVVIRNKIDNPGFIDEETIPQV